ncbi:hypothetical protein AKG34_07340 [Peribacillus butanolivorans]|uniref:LysR family transcriptional regulator n=1 Tax=Peribacillus butanolivorans TaxID=421767 RepID=UPI0006A7578D|nr:LysR family transcriptional regulator [Peribacillus butanolivorans]KON68642.1 hypothetical protein AKG34_07340 [Peribacillus butanolivorans]MED3692087.1 LysR family transcriptional regulator [Peribacillus butanolivorans]
MDIRQLSYFISVVENKSFSKAAKKLHLSQPSLSNAITKLEHNIGFPLLERSTRSVRLSDSGELFYQRATEILKKFQQFEIESAEIQQVGNKQLSIGIIESTKHWISQVIRDYNKHQSITHYQLDEILSKDNVINALLNYKNHLVLTNQEITHQELNVQKLYSEKLCLIANVNHALFKIPNISLSDIQPYPFIICSDGFETRNNIFKAFEAENLSLDVQFSVERFETICELISNDLGISILPERYCESINDSRLHFEYLDSSYFNRTVYLVTCKNRFVAPHVNLFIKHIFDFHNLEVPIE